MGFLRTLCDLISIQQLPERRIPVPRGITAQNEGRFREVGLGCKWSFIRRLSPPYAVGDPRQYPVWLFNGINR